jgi:polyferredoxin
MDACDAVMAKIGRPPGLIRYSSQARDRGERGSLVRARTLIYPLLFGTVMALFALVFLSQRSFNAVILREPGNPDTIAADGRVQNLWRLKLTNRLDAKMDLSLTVIEPAGAEVRVTEEELELEPYQTETFHVQVFCPPERFVNGRAPMKLAVGNDRGESRILEFKLIGPYRTSSAPPPADFDREPPADDLEDHNR